jgi:transposase
MNVQIASPGDWLGLPGLQIIGREDAETHTVIHVRGTVSVNRCLRGCTSFPANEAAITKHGTEAQEFRDTTLGGKPVSLRTDRQRYRCMVCKKLFYQPMLSIDGSDLRPGSPPV